MKPFLLFFLTLNLHSATPTPISTPAHKRPALHYDASANKALHDKFEAKRNAGKIAVLADMKKQLDALGNAPANGAASIDLTYWKAHRRDAVGSLRPDQRYAVMEFYRNLEQYNAVSAVPENGQTAKAKAPDAAKMKEALEGRLKQVGLDREMAAKKG